jgi:hypothetical protein
MLSDSIVDDLVELGGDQKTRAAIEHYMFARYAPNLERMRDAISEYRVRAVKKTLLEGPRNPSWFDMIEDQPEVNP